MAYLHEASNQRIIYRDIKLSNILLEHDFIPRIADFGLARLFPEDKTHISQHRHCRGYMAPEYVVRGKLTGVLMIEVITGRRNKAFSQDASSTLQTVWNRYGTSNLVQVVDPVLGDNFNKMEV